MSSTHAQPANDGTRASVESRKMTSSPPPKAPRAVLTNVEVSVDGMWHTIPALDINGMAIITRGRRLKLASVHEEEWLEKALDDPESCIRILKDRAFERAFPADIFTFSERPPVTRSRYDYYSEPDSVAAIPITTFKKWWDDLPQVTRKNVRRSQRRGVVVEVRELDDQLIRDIVELTKDSPVRQGRRFVHFGKNFEQTKKDQSTFSTHSDFICAYAGDELIGLLKLVYGDGIASILQFLPKASQQDKRPANALMAKAVEICETRKIPYLLFGRYQYGNKRYSSLLEFKLRNGFQEILVPRYFIPLTAWGSFCLKLNLHRGIIGLLPDTVLSKALAVRARWYSFAASLSRRSSIAEQPNRIRQTERSNPPAGSTSDEDL